MSACDNPHCALGRHDRDPVVMETSLSRQNCPVANSALFELLFMDTIYGHRSTLFTRGFQTNGTGKKKKKKRPPEFGASQ